MASHTHTSHSISAAELARTLGSARHPLVVDVRRQAAFSASQHLICGSLYRPPEQVASWSRDLLAEKPVVVTCVHGHEVGRARPVSRANRVKRGIQRQRGSVVDHRQACRRRPARFDPVRGNLNAVATLPCCGVRCKGYGSRSVGS